MGCRVGITTDLQGRRQYWKSKYPRFYNWKVMGAYNSKKEAQRAENRLAKQYGCTHGRGGSGPERSTWYVYMFEF